MRGGLRIRGDEVGKNAKPLKMGKKDIAYKRGHRTIRPRSEATLRESTLREFFNYFFHGSRAL